jgi:hypothetical protein
MATRSFVLEFVSSQCDKRWRVRHHHAKQEYLSLAHDFRPLPFSQSPAENITPHCGQISRVTDYLTHHA